MENLNALPGDNEINIPLDPSRAELILPDNEDKIEVKLPDETSPLGGIHQRVADLDPVITAQKIELAKKINEPELYVDKNFDQLKKIDFSKDESYWNKLEKDHPIVSTFLKEPKNMAVAKNDIENLRKMENIVQDKNFFVDLYDATQSGLAGTYENIAGIPALAYSAAALPQNLLVKAIGRPDLQVTPYEALLNNPVSKHYAVQKEAYAPEEMSKSVSTQFKDGDYTGGARTLMLQLAQNAPQQLTNIALALSSAGLGTSMLVSGGIQASGTLKEGLDKSADPASSTINALAQGGFEAGIENMAFGTTGSIRAIKELGEALTKNLGADAAKSAWKEFGKQVIHSFGGEAFEEGLTTVAQNSTAYATGIDSTALDNLGRDVIDSAAVGGFSGAGSTSIGIAYQKAVNARKASRMKNMYLELGKTIEESQLRQNLPSEHAALLNEITKNGKVENIYVGIDAVKTYAQSKNIDVGVLGKELGIEDQVNEAIETGGDLKIPLAKFASKIVGTEHYEGLANDVRFSASDLSVNEVKTHDSEITNQLMAEENHATQNAKLSEEQKAQSEIVYNEMKTELINRGQDGDTAAASAKVYQAMIATRAAQRGISVEQSHAEMKPTIINGDAESNPLEFKRKPIPQFESDSIVHEDQIKKTLTELGLPETYQHQESISAIRAQLALFQQEISQAEAGKRTFRPGEVGSDQVVEGVKSTFPKWFRDGDYKTKKDFEKLVTKGNSKNFSKLVEFAIKTLKEGHGENAGNLIAPNLDFVSLVDPESLDSSLESTRMMAQRKEGQYFQTDKEVRGYIDGKAKGKAILITRESEAPAAEYDGLTGQLKINAEKVSTPEQLDQVLSQFGEAKRASVDGKFSDTINGEVHEIDARKVVNALAAKLYNLERLAECSR